MTGLPNSQEFRVLREKVEILNGDRGNPRKAAMREGDAIDLREFIAALRKRTADVQIQVQEAEESLATLAGSLSATQTEFADLAANVTTLQATLVDVQAAIEAAQDAITELNDNGAAILVTVEGLELTVAALASDITILGTALDAIQSAATSVTVPGPTATDVAAPPTAAEYNMLLADVAALRGALADLRAAVIA